MHKLTNDQIIALSPTAFAKHIAAEYTVPMSNMVHYLGVGLDLDGQPLEDGPLDYALEIGLLAFQMGNDITTWTKPRLADQDQLEDVKHAFDPNRTK
jgi:hypothetical protein